MWCSYSKHRLDAHLQFGPTIIIQTPIIVMKCQTIVQLCIFSILMCLPTSPHNSHKHLHICTQPKAKLLDLLHQPMQQAVFGSSTSQEISSIHNSVNITPTLTTVLSSMNSTLSTLLLKGSILILYSQLCLVLPSSPCFLRCSEQTFASSSNTHTQKPHVNLHDTSH